MKKYSIILVTAMMSIITPSTLLGKLSFERVYAFFGKYSHEAVVENDFELAQPGTLHVSNSNGDITIKTEWKRDSICLKAVKKATKDEDLSAMHVNVNRNPEKANELTINSSFDASDLKGAIDYELIVPAQTKLQLSTDNGSITINDVNGEIIATTVNGNIEINNTTNTITAQSEETGGIVISNAQGNIKATTMKGNITIENATKSIIATAQKGNINTICSEVPSTSRIVLNTEESGGINLSLPSAVNATLHGKTVKGRLTSDHYVTIKPFTTKLNRTARRELEKQVNGILGTGEADIRLTSNGSIKILETKAA